ncbi:hypothetical protein A2W13_02750 [Candidatus Woesebacteria bacterium RBG_16_36_11]|uniref:DNA ligase (ATP) n=3 Tax=Candidatus Woeseibacteriota TaxID=1752722 RepID=A0A1F7X840_9BACT|nr:MAG: hypothetical protein A2Z67_05575 [Candidatus Woesebacteria bacterium RBG_13_36_22]OGM11083.1 MAG: hypothetical protein A2W13_02750 [Candidatus Woesebacteria bacterium RBG_16_36_11]OGM17144.1 MAG: hypothetical protein A2V55_00375 [Candidatus Woesebacteria bacterium RBG_19FT_COMBO_37_29]
MKFKELSLYLEKLEKTPSRNTMTGILADLFKKSQAKEIDKIVYLLLGSLGPKYEGIVFDMADKMILRAIAKAYDKDLSLVSNLYKNQGDLGNVAQELSKNTKNNFAVTEVFKRLLEITKDEGEGSQERKVKDLAYLFSNLDPLSCRFLARIPVGRLRLGFSDKTILDALSWMIKGDKSVKSFLEKAYQVLPDPGLLAKKVKMEGLEKATREVKPIVGVPVLPMLAQRLKSPKEMIEKMHKVAVEPKLDGLRLSIHFKKGKNLLIKAFTRNLNETSWMFPELKTIKDSINASEVILDSEAVGLEEETKQMADFQTTMTRRRKHEIEKALSKIGIKFFIFDILSKNGKNLMDLPYLERRKILERTFKESRNFKLVDYKITQKPEDIESIYKTKIGLGFEGVLVKKIDGSYIPGRTGWRWVKMKQEEKAKGKLADTVDAVVMGYTRGKGKRTQFGLGQFLVGVLGGEKIKTVTKIGTGLTDEQFREMKTRLVKLEVKEKPLEYDIHKNYTPDVWVRPYLVVEIAADEISKSPTHSAGYALRFPRLVRFRDDKAPSEATTTLEIKKLFELQK